jgi:hypothetical protein
MRAESPHFDGISEERTYLNSVAQNFGFANFPQVITNRLFKGETER